MTQEVRWKRAVRLGGFEQRLDGVCRGFEGHLDEQYSGNDRGSHYRGYVREPGVSALKEPDLDNFVDLICAYPTMAEVLKIAAISRRHDPGKLSCCAS